MKWWGHYLWISLFTGCVTGEDKSSSFNSVATTQSNIVLLDPSLERLSNEGPFVVESRVDRLVTLNLNETLSIDQFFAVSQEKIPVIILVHGNYSSKKSHRRQAEQLASWGFQIISVELPNRDQWILNGKRLAQMIKIMYRNPEIFEGHLDSQRIVLAGHSFGGSASIIAVSEGAPVSGLILLDPAVVHASVEKMMGLISLPTVLLGADQKLFLARGRKKFMKNLRGEMIEITVPGAVHDDAQGPSSFSKWSLGVDPFTSEVRQKKFMALMTSAVISMATGGTLDFAKRIYAREKSLGSIRAFNYQEAR